MAKLMLLEGDGEKVEANLPVQVGKVSLNSHGNAGEKLRRKMVLCPFLYVFK